jgi:SAM-dependent methyltransferase
VFSNSTSGKVDPTSLDVPHYAREAIAAAATILIPSETRRKLAERMPRLPLARSDRHRAGITRDAAHFESLYGRDEDDPWHYRDRANELEKYGRTLAACGNGPLRSALELACATGLFTEMLAPRCRSLLAVDISATAVARARNRVAAFAHVRCERRTLPGDMPEGPFDLIVCSDLLYYWSEEDVRDAARAMAARLEPGGRLVAVDFAPGLNLTGARVHEILREELTMTPIQHAELERHLLDSFEKR